MKKKGFTLTELIAVIIIIGVVLIIAIPSITNLVNKEENNISESMEKVLLQAGELYVQDNSKIYKKLEGNTYCIKLRELIENEYLTNPLKDPTTGKEVSSERYVKASIENNTYKYSIVETCNEIINVQASQTGNIDTSAPITIINNISLTTDSAIVTANCVDYESQIIRYEFSKDGTNWVNNGLSSSYIFKGLEQNTAYTFRVRCTNGVGLDSVANQAQTTKKIKNPEIAQYSQIPSSGKYAQERTISITYFNENVTNPTYYFKSTSSAIIMGVGTSSISPIIGVCGTGTSPGDCTYSDVIAISANTWYKVDNNIVSTSNQSESSPITINLAYKSNGSLYAKTIDGSGNTATASTYKVTNIDRTVPKLSITDLSTTTNSATISFSASDAESGIVSTTCVYGTSTSYGSAGTVSGNKCVINNLKSDTIYYFKLVTTNGSGLTITKTSSTVSKAIIAPIIAQYSQTPSSGTWATERIIRITYSNTNITSPEYYFKTTTSATVSSGVVTASCGTGKDPVTCESSSVTTLVANTWYKTSGTTINLTYTSTGSLYAQTKDASGNTAISSTFTITNIGTGDDDDSDCDCEAGDYCGHYCSGEVYFIDGDPLPYCTDEWLPHC